jgi:hypothetical protein
MANTTNYNWETPDDTDLVKDGAAAIRTLGSSVDTTTKNLNPQTTTGALAYRSATANVNTALPIGTAGQILAVSGGVPAWINNDQGDITEVAAGTGISVASGTGPVPTVSINTAVTADLTTAQTLTNKTLTSPVLTTPTISTIDAKGDLLVGTADNTIGRLAVGTNNYVLTADSAETTGLKWAAPAGGGKVLQVVQATTTTDTTIATTTPTDTTITATITPSSASSKVLIIINGQCRYNRTQTAIGVGGVVKRGATTIVDYEGYGLSYTQVNNSSSGVATGHTMNIAYLDSPATTSATTYKLQAQISTTADSATSTWQIDGPSQIILMEIGA